MFALGEQPVAVHSCTHFAGCFQDLMQWKKQSSNFVEIQGQKSPPSHDFHKNRRYNSIIFLVHSSLEILLLLFDALCRIGCQEPRTVSSVLIHVYYHCSQIEVEWHSVGSLGDKSSLSRGTLLGSPA